MHILANALIVRAKLTHYLLVYKEADDKSGFLALAGFTLDNVEDLEQALREHIRTYEARLTAKTNLASFMRW